MSELGELFEGYKEARKEKKRQNLSQSEQILIERGVSYEKFNQGVHFVVRYNGLIADFWPSTGKYCIRGRNYKRGVFNLLKDLGVKK